MVRVEQGSAQAQSDRPRIIMHEIRLGQLVMRTLGARLDLQEHFALHVKLWGVN